MQNNSPARTAANFLYIRRLTVYNEQAYGTKRTPHRLPYTAAGEEDMGKGPSEAPAPAFRRDNEARGVSNCSADAPPRRLRARTQPANMRATAKQRGCDRRMRANGCGFALLILSALFLPQTRGGRSKEENRICVESLATSAGNRDRKSVV